jgi:hypothetical protein
MTEQLREALTDFLLVLRKHSDVLSDGYEIHALDRAAIIKECAKAAQNFETKRHWSDDPDMQNQAYYTEGEVAHEIATTILALASAHQPAAIDKAAAADNFGLTVEDLDEDDE